MLFEIKYDGEFMMFIPAHTKEDVRRVFRSENKDLGFRKWSISKLSIEEISLTWSNPIECSRYITSDPPVNWLPPISEVLAIHLYTKH